MNPDTEDILMIALGVLVCMIAGFVLGYMACMFSQIDPAALASPYADSAITIICMGCGK